MKITAVTVLVLNNMIIFISALLVYSTEPRPWPNLNTDLLEPIASSVHVHYHIELIQVIRHMHVRTYTPNIKELLGGKGGLWYLPPATATREELPTPTIYICTYVHPHVHAYRHACT